MMDSHDSRMWGGASTSTARCGDVRRGTDPPCRRIPHRPCPPLNPLWRSCVSSGPWSPPVYVPASAWTSTPTPSPSCTRSTPWGQRWLDPLVTPERRDSAESPEQPDGVQHDQHADPMNGLLRRQRSDQPSPLPPFGVRTASAAESVLNLTFRASAHGVDGMSSPMAIPSSVSGNSAYLVDSRSSPMALPSSVSGTSAYSVNAMSSPMAFRSSSVSGTSAYSEDSMSSPVAFPSSVSGTSAPCMHSISSPMAFRSSPVSWTSSPSVNGMCSPTAFQHQSSPMSIWTNSQNRGDEEMMSMMSRMSVEDSQASVKRKNFKSFPKKATFCAFCKGNSEHPKQYMSHRLHGQRPDGTLYVECEVLRQSICEICKATGDNAHTRSHCPFNTKPSVAVMLKKTARRCDGSLRKHFKH